MDGTVRRRRLLAILVPLMTFTGGCYYRANLGPSEELIGEVRALRESVDRLVAAQEATAPSPETRNERPARVRIRTDGSPTRGAPDALVEIVEFSDFDCPYCAKAQAGLEGLLEEYPDRVRLVFKNFPLESIHPRARAAAVAALAAGRQDRYWEMHDLLFEDRIVPTDEGFQAYVDRLGLDREQFWRDFRDPALQTLVSQDLAEGRRGSASEVRHRSS